MEFTYLGLAVQTDRYIVPMEQVDRQIRELVEQNPKIIPVTDRPAGLGDEVLISYRGFAEGKQFPGGTAENYPLVLGSGAFIPGFEDQLVGKSAGQECRIDLTFPEKYHVPELAGKQAYFLCTVQEVRRRQAYQMDDRFAREVGGFPSLEQMREQMRAGMQSYADRQMKLDIQDQLLRQAADTLDFTPTPEALAQEVEQQMQVLQAQLSRQGLTMDMYCRFLNTTEQQLRQDAVPVAEGNLRRFAAVTRIAQLEKLTVSQEEIDRAAQRLRASNQLTEEQMQGLRDDDLAEAMRRSVLTDKVVKIVEDAARITIR